MNERIEKLWEMHQRMCEVDNEELYMSWIMCGVPDGTESKDDPILADIAEEDEDYLHICELYKQLIALDGE